MEEILNTTGIVITRIGQRVGWVLSLPIQILASVITWIRARRYDPERVMCPACGFRGYEDKRASTIKFTRTIGPEKAALRHYCLRCGCDEFYSKVVAPVDSWLPSKTIDAIKDAAQRSVL